MRGSAESYSSSMAAARRFVEWEERFVSKDRGSRVVHYYLKDQAGTAVLAVVGTERSLRHMVYVVADEFLSLPGAEPKACFKWRSRREVVDWLTTNLSRSSRADHHLHISSFSFVVVRFSYSMFLWRNFFWECSLLEDSFREGISKHDSSRTSDADISNSEEMDELNSYHNNFKSKVSRKSKTTSKDIIWVGSSWTCRKQLRHYEAFHRSGITITVNSFVLVMAEENMHHIAYLEDLYEDKKNQKKVRVRWFHRKNEVVGIIPSPPAHFAEVFVTPFTQVLSVECVDGFAVILTPEHYEKCLSMLSHQEIKHLHVCFRQFDNEGVKYFNLNDMQGYWNQEILRRLGLSDPHEFKAGLSDSLEIEGDDSEVKSRMKKGPKRSRGSHKRVSTSYGDHLKVKNKASSSSAHKHASAQISERLNAHFSQSKKFINSNQNHGGVGTDGLESPSFDVGDEVEILCQDSGIRGCWFRCTVMKKLPYRLKVQYKDVQNEDDTDNLEEWISSYKVATSDKHGVRINGRLTIRPCPPEDSSWSIDVGSLVDAWMNDGWWEGVVVMLKEPSTVQIYFPGENFTASLQKSKLRPSKEWFHNCWITLEKKVDLVASLLLCEASQLPDSVGLHSSSFSNDYLGVVASGEVAENGESVDRKNLLLYQVPIVEPWKLSACEKKETDASKEDDEIKSTFDFKEMSSKMPYNAQKVAEPFSVQDIIVDRQDIGSDDVDVCSFASDDLTNELKFRISRKRQRPSDSAFLSRSGTACGKEETERLNNCKLIEPDAIERNQKLRSNSDNFDREKECLIEGKKSIQGHESGKPMHGTSMSEAFRSSVHVASLVMSR